VSEIDKNWKNIKKIVLNVNSINTVIDQNYNIILDCSFENIAKGRCHLKIVERLKKTRDTLFVHTDQALMIVKIFYERKKMDFLLNLFTKKSNSKKIKVNLEILDSLLVNKSGYLYIKNNLEIGIKSISWSIPIL
tara:strand:+ start:207 stop:611 length:405 start_codon:yes stop_codon:yes gene_type:complete